MMIFKKYASLVKLSHMIFAMPFAMVGYSYALTLNHLEFDPILLGQVILSLFFARNTAMAFNRWADREIDAKNPRTAMREIPAGALSARHAMWFVVVNSLLFIAVACTINPLTAILSPIALAVVLFYSYCKRFTAAAHLVLGAGLAIAPMGAYIAVTGHFSEVVTLLSLAVMCWCAGFDIIYALQDAQFDKEEGLHSIPSKFSLRNALYISRFLHFSAAIFITLFAIYALPNTPLVWVATASFILLMILQHILVTPSKTDQIAAAFGTLNGIASVVYAILVNSALWHFN